MGMDVWGRHPDSEAGEYFRANLWGWHPIYQMIIELCSDLLDEETLALMETNDGAGPEDAATCKKMAIRFSNWMEHNINGAIMESADLRVDDDGRFLTEEETAQNPNAGHSPFRIKDEDLKEWIEFLWHCGGFNVY
jgi:hypothetical protein